VTSQKKNEINNKHQKDSSDVKPNSKSAETGKMDLNKKLLAIMKNRIKEKKGTTPLNDKSMLTSSCGASRFLELSHRSSKRKSKRGSNRQIATPSELSTTTQVNITNESFQNETTRINLPDKPPTTELTFSPEDVERVVQYYNIMVEKGLFVPPHSYPNNHVTASTFSERPLKLYANTTTNNSASQSSEDYTSTSSQVAGMDRLGIVSDMSPSCTLFESNFKVYNSVSYMVDGTEFSVIEEEMTTYPYVSDYACTIEAEGADTTCSVSWHQTNVTPSSVETELSEYESSWCTQEQQEGFIITTISNSAIMESYTPTIDCEIKGDANNKSNTATSDIIVGASEPFELLITGNAELPQESLGVITETEMIINDPDGVDPSDAIFEQVINL
jgi:hypothetical protein